jgi:hypothetical protein
VYPEYKHIWKSEKAPPGSWKDVKLQRDFFDTLASKWNIQKPEDWNAVTTAMVMKEGGHFVKRYYNSSLIRGTRSRFVANL